MIDYELFCKIKNHHEQEGLSATQIAAELCLDARTVAKWMEEKHFHPRKQTLRPSKLDPFKDDILRMLSAHQYTATQIFQRVKEQGFDGGYTIVNEHVQKVRPSILSL